MLHKNIDRHRAELDYRLTMNAASVATGEGITEHLKNLQKQMGTIVEIDEAKASLNEEYDREGLLSLKGLGKIR